MIGAVWGLGVLGRTDAKGMPRPLDGVLLAEAFGEEIVFERPPAFVQKALAKVRRAARPRRGRSVTGDDVLRAAIVDPDRWPDPRGMKLYYDLASPYAYLAVARRGRARRGAGAAARAGRRDLRLARARRR